MSNGNGSRKQPPNGAKSRLRPKARHLYVHQGKSTRQIAKELGLAHRTIGVWCSSGKWVEARERFLNGSDAKINALAEDKLAKSTVQLYAEFEGQGDDFLKTCQTMLAKAETPEEIETLSRTWDRVASRLILLRGGPTVRTETLERPRPLKDRTKEEIDAVFSAFMAKQRLGLNGTRDDSTDLPAG